MSSELTREEIKQQDGMSVFNRRIVYEQVILFDLFKLRNSSRATSRGNFARYDSMQKRAELYSKISNYSGITAAISPIIANSSFLASLVTHYNLNWVGAIISLGCGVVFYFANQQRDYYKTEAARSHRAAGKWMKLYTLTIDAQNKILHCYISANKSVEEIQEICAPLIKLKIELDEDLDSPTEPKFFAQVEPDHKAEKNKDMNEYISIIQQLKKTLSADIPPFAIQPHNKILH